MPAGHYILEGHTAHLDERGQPRIITRRFKVEPWCNGIRLDQYLCRKIPRLSRNKLQKIIRTQLAAEDGRPVKPSSVVRTGERFTLRRPAEPEPPAPLQFDIIHDDALYMVIDKPPRLAMHATARFYFNTLSRILSERYPDDDLQMAHRLDRETSGCLVIAKGKEAASRLKGAFENRKVQKTYLALVHGTPAPETTLVDAALRPAESGEGLNVRMVVDPDGLPAQTEIVVRETRGAVSLVECKPITGRQHQIRAHLAHIGCPIVGDKLYAHGDEAFRRFCALEGQVPEEQWIDEFGLARHALHAAEICFPHPQTGKKVAYSSQLPADMADFFVGQVEGPNLAAG